MTKKAKDQLNETLRAHDELETLRAFRAGAVALQQQVAQLQATNKMLAESNEELSNTIEGLKDKVDSLENDISEADESEYGRGYDDGYMAGVDSVEEDKA
jgi:predicted nuclease with TOPRIM domain